MANAPLPGEEPGQLEALLDRWQTSLDLHARYAALDDTRYWHVQPWPRHERPQRWIIQLARKRILALKRIVAQRQSEGDRAFVEGIEIMGFLATLVGLTSVERFIPLATPETERRDVLAAKPEQAARSEPASPRPADTTRSRTASARTSETTRQMPALPAVRGAAAQSVARGVAAQSVARGVAAQHANTADKPAPAAIQSRRREPARPATIRPRKLPTGISQMEHVVIADAVRLLGWGRQWHELAEMIARLAERPAPSEIRRILRTYREQIDAVAQKRRE